MDFIMPLMVSHYKKFVKSMIVIWVRCFYKIERCTRICNAIPSLVGVHRFGLQDSAMFGADATMFAC